MKGAQRAFAALVAASAWLAFLLPLVLISGHRGSVPAALWFMARFFSYLLDGAVAVAFTGLAIRPRLAPSLIGGLALNAALVAVVYRALLAGLHAGTGPGQVGNLFLHTVTPALVVLFWAACVPRGRLRYGDLARWASAPLGYLAYALALGQLDGFYPYPFLHTVTPALAVLFWAACVPRGRLRYGDLARWASAPLGYLAYALALGQLDGFYPYPFLNGPAIGWGAVARNAGAIAAGYLAAGTTLIWADRQLGRGMRGRFTRRGA